MTAPSPCILVVDDEAEIVAAVTQAGEALGFRVVGLTDSDDFMDNWRALDPDGIVMDVVMPNRDGIELLRNLQAAACRTPILIMSGYHTAYLEAAHRLGEIYALNVVEAVTKPLRLGVLKRFLAEVSSYAEARRAADATHTVM